MDTSKEDNRLGPLLERVRAAYGQYGGELAASLTSVLDYFDNKNNPREPVLAPASASNRTLLAAIAGLAAFRLETASPQEAANALRDTLAMMRKISAEEFIPARDLQTGKPLEYSQPKERIALKEGDELGQYRIVGFLGSGATSAVYLAYCRDSLLPHRRVALKVLKDPVANLPNHIAVAERWVRLADRHVVRLEDLCQDKGFVFYVTERIEGKSLQSLFKGYTLEERFATLPRILLMVCEALGVAHASVKAGSILDGRVPLHIRQVDGLIQLRELVEQLLSPIYPGAPRQLQEVSDWIRQLLYKCIPDSQAGSFASVERAREYIRFHAAPEAAGRVRIVAHQTSTGIDYQLECDGRIERQILNAPCATPLLTDDIALRWQQIGEFVLGGKTTRVLQELDFIRASYLMMLPARLVEVLAERDLSTVTLVHDRALNGIPWEALYIAAQEELGIRFALSRLPHTQTVAPRPRPRSGPLKATLIYSTMLPACRKEVESLASLFRAHGIETRELATNEGSGTLRLHVGTCDILHFAGHGIFVPPRGDFSGAGLHFTSEDALAARELKALWRERSPMLVFANTCYAGAHNVGFGREPFHPDVCIGFAQEALSAGATNFVGTALPILDGPAACKFAETFYRHWLAGRVISQAMWEARRACRRADGGTGLLSLQHTLLGDPFTRVENASEAHGATA